MKVFYLAALFGGAVSAVQPLVGRDDGTTTAVVYVTSTYTITKCAASVTNCPAASATELFTSTTVMSVTTTICPVTSTPGDLPPANTDTLSDSVPTSYRPGYPGVSSISVSLVSPNPSVPSSGISDGLSTTSSLPVETSALPTGSVGSDRPSSPGSLTDSVPTSFPISLTASTVGYAPSQPLGSASSPGTYTDAVPTSGVTTSGVYDQPSATSSDTDAVSTSGYPGSSRPSSNTDAVPTSGYPGSSRPSSNTDAVPTSGYPGSSRPSSNTDAVPTSGYPGSSALSASTGTDAVPTSGYPGSSILSTFTGTDTVPTSGYPGSSALTASTGPDAIPTSSPTAPSSTLSAVYPSRSVPAIPSVTSASSGLVYPVPTPPASTPITGGTTRITSHLTLISTSYVTAPLPVDTETDAVPTSGATGYLPSGSGYPYPSNSANGTIVAPTPSYIEVPVNMGQIVAAGQGPIVAIVVAFAFALFA